MYIPNYIPEPDAIPENVTKEKYALRLVFIRQVVARFGLCIALISGMVSFVSRPPLVPTVLALLSLIAVCSLTRTLLRTKSKEYKVAESQLGLLVLGYLALTAALLGVQFPVWSLLFGFGCFFVYTAFCGRDFSFVGAYTLSVIVSSVLIASLAVFEHISPLTSAKALGWNAVGLLYVVYDLAALMSRRRKHETWAAVADLFRDVLNVFGYSYRVVRHWRRHRILNDFTPENPFK